jgi:hypothetical protein
VVVTDIDIVGVSVNEPEADTPLVVDGYRMLSPAIVAQRVETVARGHFQISQACREVDVFEFAHCSSCDIRREPARLSVRKQILRAHVRKRPDHAISVTRNVTSVKLSSSR